MIKLPLPLILLTLTVFPSLCGCADALCGNDITQTSVSPDGKVKAVVFTRNCGATTGYSTHVSLLPARDSLPNDGGNTFIVTDLQTLGLKWNGNRQLLITKEKKPKEIKRAEVFRAVETVPVITGYLQREKVAVRYAP